MNSANGRGDRPACSQAGLRLFRNERTRRMRPGRGRSRPNGVEAGSVLGRVGWLHGVCSTMNTGDRMGGLGKQLFRARSVRPHSALERLLRAMQPAARSASGTGRFHADGAGIRPLLGNRRVLHREQVIVSLLLVAIKCPLLNKKLCPHLFPTESAISCSQIPIRR